LFLKIHICEGIDNIKTYSYTINNCIKYNYYLKHLILYIICDKIKYIILLIKINEFNKVQVWMK